MVGLRDLGEMFLIHGIVFSHDAARDWVARLTPALAESLRRCRRCKAGRSWHIDETYIKSSFIKPVILAGTSADRTVAERRPRTYQIAGFMRQRDSIYD
jgi:hypothetical protein